MSSVTFGHCTPFLRVADLDTSLAYYTGVLGFTLDWRDRGFAQVTRGEAAHMLAQGELGCRRGGTDGRLARWRRRALDTAPDGSWRTGD